MVQSLWVDFIGVIVDSGWFQSRLDHAQSRLHPDMFLTMHYTFIVDSAESESTPEPARVDYDSSRVDSTGGQN